MGSIDESKPRLPTELIAMIINFCLCIKIPRGSNKRTRRQPYAVKTLCSHYAHLRLVNKVFYGLATPHLFRVVKIQGYHHELLTQLSGLAASGVVDCIEQIHISPPWFPKLLKTGARKSVRRGVDVPELLLRIWYRDFGEHLSRFLGACKRRIKWFVVEMRSNAYMLMEELEKTLKGQTDLLFENFAFHRPNWKRADFLWGLPNLRQIESLLVDRSYGIAFTDEIQSYPNCKNLVLRGPHDNGTYANFHPRRSHIATNFVNLSLGRTGIPAADLINIISCARNLRGLELFYIRIYNEPDVGTWADVFDTLCNSATLEWVDFEQLWWVLDITPLDHPHIKDRSRITLHADDPSIDSAEDFERPLESFHRPDYDSMVRLVEMLLSKGLASEGRKEKMTAYLAPHCTHCRDWLIDHKLSYLHY